MKNHLAQQPDYPRNKITQRTDYRPAMEGIQPAAEERTVKSMLLSVSCWRIRRGRISQSPCLNIPHESPQQFPIRPQHVNGATVSFSHAGYKNRLQTSGTAEPSTIPSQKIPHLLCWPCTDVSQIHASVPCPTARTPWRQEPHGATHTTPSARSARMAPKKAYFELEDQPAE